MNSAPGGSSGCLAHAEHVKAQTADEWFASSLRGRNFSQLGNERTERTSPHLPYRFVYESDWSRVQLGILSIHSARAFHREDAKKCRDQALIGPESSNCNQRLLIRLSGA